MVFKIFRLRAYQNKAFSLIRSLTGPIRKLSGQDSQGDYFIFTFSEVMTW